MSACSYCNVANCVILKDKLEMGERDPLMWPSPRLLLWQHDSHTQRKVPLAGAMREKWVRYYKQIYYFSFWVFVFPSFRCHMGLETNLRNLRIISFRDLKSQFRWSWWDKIRMSCSICFSTLLTKEKNGPCAPCSCFSFPLFPLVLVNRESGGFVCIPLLYTLRVLLG